MTDQTKPLLTDEQIVTMLYAIDDIAREHDLFDYGLPLGFDNPIVGRTPEAKMIAAVRAAITQQEGSGEA